MKKLLFLFTVFFSSLNAQLNDDMVCDIVKLSYIKVDEALGILKSMGYNVIEFESSNSENSIDSHFNPQSTIDKSSLSIIKFPDSGQGFLDNTNESSDSDEGGNDLQSYLGGSTFPTLTSGNPLQRLLVCYDENGEKDYFHLIEHLKNKLDVGAQQIMIDALVLEIDSDDMNKFKVEMGKISESENIEIDKDKSFLESLSTLNVGWNYSNLSISAARTIADLIDVQVEALLQNENTEILSKPSVLVMDGRQARIQVGQQIPISKFPVTTTGNEVTIPDVEYIPVGIILNLRPRIGDDGRQVTMQIETIITETESNDQAEGVLSAPTINTRKVESYVRIANNTPFIIGGLISDKNTMGKSRIPLISKIPLLGKLFKSNYKQKAKREVIVVITPHVINENYAQFSKVIPQDSDRFDSFGNRLFLNSYRLKESDIFDLDYIVESEALNTLQVNMEKQYNNQLGKTSELTQKIINGYIPGEEVFIKRMLYDIIKKKKYFRYINTDNIIYFNETGSVRSFSSLMDSKSYVKMKDNEGVQLYFKDIEQTFERPFLSHELIQISNYDVSLREVNSSIGPTILLSNDKHIQKLLNVLILKHVLELNEDLDLSLNAFRPGLEIIFPSPEILENNKLLIDKDVARFYYEINDYYHVFEKAFNNN